MSLRLTRRRRIYEGKAKVLFEGPEPGTIVQYFKDDASAFNNSKRGTITGKGVLNNRISEYLMTKLGEIGVPTHFMKRLNMREQLVRHVEIIPLKVVIHNVAAGSLARRLGIAEGTVLPRSIIEFFYKKQELSDPIVTDEHITAFGWASPQELEEMMALSLRINDYLSGLFLGIGLKLIDFKLEFGRFWDNEEMRIVLADEISPDSCRLWDVRTNEKMDKDRFRQDLGKVEEAYREVAMRLGLLPEGIAPDMVHQIRRAAEKRMIKVRVDVMPKEGVLDPQGKAIGHALSSLGFQGVDDVRAGKVIMLNIKESSPEKAVDAAKKMAEKLLANLVIEDYRISVL